jgi:hypothetical protein
VRRARVVGVELGECFDEQWLAHVTRAEVLVTKLIEQVTRSETKSGKHTKAIDAPVGATSGSRRPQRRFDASSIERTSCDMCPKERLVVSAGMRLRRIRTLTAVARL